MNGSNPQLVAYQIKRAKFGRPRRKTKHKTAWSSHKAKKALAAVALGCSFESACAIAGWSKFAAHKFLKERPEFRKLWDLAKAGLELGLAETVIKSAASDGHLALAVLERKFPGWGKTLKGELHVQHEHSVVPQQFIAMLAQRRSMLEAGKTNRAIGSSATAETTSETEGGVVDVEPVLAPSIARPPTPPARAAVLTSPRQSILEKFGERILGGEAEEVL